MERGLRLDAGGVVLEGSEVMLQSGQQGDMAHAAVGLERGEQVAQRAAVDLDVLRFGVLSDPGGDDDDLRTETGDGGPSSVGVEEVGLHRVTPSGRRRRVGRVREPPSLAHQLSGDRLARDAAGPDDERSARICKAHQDLPSNTVFSCSKQYSRRASPPEPGETINEKVDSARILTLRTPAGACEIAVRNRYLTACASKNP